MPYGLFDYTPDSMIHTMGANMCADCPDGYTVVCQPPKVAPPVPQPILPPSPAPIRNPAYCRDQLPNPRTGALMGLVSNPSQCAMIGGCVQIGDCYYRDLPRLVNPPYQLPSPIALPPKPPALPPWMPIGPKPVIRPSPITPGGQPPSRPSPYPSEEQLRKEYQDYMNSIGNPPTVTNHYFYWRAERLRQGNASPYLSPNNPYADRPVAPKSGIGTGTLIGGQRPPDYGINSPYRFY